MDIVIQLEQQRENRADFQKQLTLKPSAASAGYGGPGQPIGEPIPANPARIRSPKRTRKRGRTGFQRLLVLLRRRLRLKPRRSRRPLL